MSNILFWRPELVASYNSGPEMCLKAPAFRRKTSYWDIRKHLPKETQGYVPAF
jgi:membrane-bound lytic murein transglycosylase D